MTKIKFKDINRIEVFLKDYTVKDMCIQLNTYMAKPISSIKVYTDEKIFTITNKQKIQYLLHRYEKFLHKCQKKI